MTDFNGPGVDVWIEALAAFSENDRAYGPYENQLELVKEIDGVEYTLSLSNYEGGFKWPGGEPDRGEVPKGPVTNIRLVIGEGGEYVDIYNFPSKLTAQDILDFASEKDVETLLFSGDDWLDGTPGADVLRGFAGDDILYGGGGKDTIYGGLGNDSVEGYARTDRLYGGDGKDELYGGADSDTLTGGSGKDDFRFEKATESDRKMSERDVVTDFERGTDRIEFTKSFARGDDLDFIGKADFDDKNQIRYETDANGVIAFVNLDGDDKAEFSVRLQGVEKVSANDFIF